jgi:uncharacterized protein (TIGR00251 family)
VIAETPDGAILEVKVIPRAGRTALAGTRAGALLVRLAAAPVEGAANDALIAFLADILRVPKSHLELVSGARSRSKRVKVKGLTGAALAERLRTI